MVTHRAQAEAIAHHGPRLARIDRQSTLGKMDVSQTFCFRVSAIVTEDSMVEDRVFKGRHFDRSVILLCIRWYLAYNLSLRIWRR
jgi:predicted component of type VI protein secretion system